MQSTGSNLEALPMLSFNRFPDLDKIDIGRKLIRILNTSGESLKHMNQIESKNDSEQTTQIQTIREFNSLNFFFNIFNKFWIGKV